MKKIYQFIVFCILFAVSFGMGNCRQAQAAVSLNQTNATICKGTKTTLEVRGAVSAVTWTTSDKKIAKVNAAGVVTGVSRGKATITASVGGAEYKCRITVNETYGASVSSITIKRPSSVMFTFTKNAVVTYKIQNADICSAQWGKWDGNEIPLQITPKKVGTTYITCSNGANNETVRIRVRVLKVPVEVTDIRAFTSDRGDFVCGENEMRLTFRQDRKSKKTMLYLIGKNGETVRTMQLGPVPAGKRYAVSWDGIDDNGENYDGQFRLKIVADGYTTRNWHYYKCYAKSPFQKGDGTRERPYEVATPEHLEKIAQFNGRHFVQVRDIDLRSELISNIFSADQPFEGSYNAKPDNINYRILHYNGNTSLFGVIGVQGELDHVIVSDARITGTGQERSAVLAEVNQGALLNCTVDEAVIYSATATDAALLAVENNGVIDRCHVHGAVYTFGSMAGGVVYNNQRVIQTGISAGLNLSATDNIAVDEDLYVGGVAAVNGQTAFIDACESSCSIQAAGTLQTPAKLYMGGIVGRNLGQVRDGNALGHFPLEYTNSLIGDAQGGVIAGENNGMITGVMYYETTGRKSSATGSGREDSLNPLKNPNEEV